MVFYNMLMCR